MKGLSSDHRAEIFLFVCSQEKSEEATTLPVRELLDEAKRDLAFKRWATAADKFGEILEQL